MKFKNWDGKDLIGDWMITIKIDGIQGRKFTYVSGSKVSTLISKNDKYLNNLPRRLPEGQIFEIFVGTCHDTWSVLSSPEGSKMRVRASQIYKLFPEIDERLILLKSVKNPSALLIQSYFIKILESGGEGLVLRRLDKEEAFIKVKLSYTHDVKITGFVEGKGRLVGKLGKFLTEQGGVGVGMTDAQRAHFWNNRIELHNTTIEVKCMGITDNNKFRQPVFKKLRPDK